MRARLREGEGAGSCGYGQAGSQATVAAGAVATAAAAAGDGAPLLDAVAAQLGVAPAAGDPAWSTLPRDRGFKFDAWDVIRPAAQCAMSPEELGVLFEALLLPTTRYPPSWAAARRLAGVGGAVGSSALHAGPTAGPAATSTAPSPAAESAQDPRPRPRSLFGRLLEAFWPWPAALTRQVVDPLREFFEGLLPRASPAADVPLPAPTCAPVSLPQLESLTIDERPPELPPTSPERAADAGWETTLWRDEHRPSQAEAIRAILDDEPLLDDEMPLGVAVQAAAGFALAAPPQPTPSPAPPPPPHPWPAAAPPPPPSLPSPATATDADASAAASSSTAATEAAVAGGSASLLGAVPAPACSFESMVLVIEEAGRRAPFLERPYALAVVQLFDALSGGVLECPCEGPVLLRLGEALALKCVQCFGQQRKAQGVNQTGRPNETVRARSGRCPNHAFDPHRPPPPPPPPPPPRHPPQPPTMSRRAMLHRLRTTRARSATCSSPPFWPRMWPRSKRWLRVSPEPTRWGQS